MKKGEGSIEGSQMALLDSADGKGRPGLAVSGYNAKGKYAVAVFLLPKAL